MGPERLYSRCDVNWEVGTKTDGPEQVEQILSTMIKYVAINEMVASFPSRRQRES
jgi:hypothetical protein